MKGFFSTLALPLLAAATPVFRTGANDIAPLVAAQNAQVIPDSYIVVFKKHVSHGQAAEHHSWVKDVHNSCQQRKRSKRSQMPFVDTIFNGMKHTYNIGSEFLGYSGHFDQDVIEQIRRHPDVSSRVQIT